jgi:serine/threonine protein kinase
MPVPRVLNAEPLPGYRLLEPLGQGGFGEVWKCEAPGGLHKAIKFVRNLQDSVTQSADGASQELRALQLIRTIRHPFLLSTERVEEVDGDLVIVMELADRNLHELLLEHQKAGRPGIPRAELIGYLREAAEVLDLMNLEHGLQHLDIKPPNLFLIGRHVKVADFGQVNSLSHDRSEVDEDDRPDPSIRLDAISPRYAAPEVFMGRISHSSDQYSLAICYHELLTSQFPFTGNNSHELAMQHIQASPELTRLPEAERRILDRALAKNPGSRFPSCSDFVEALAGVAQSVATPPPPVRSMRTDFLRNVSLPVEKALEPGLDETRLLDRSAAMEPVGSILPGFRFLECQGRAGNGEVWRARNPEGNVCLLRLVSEPENDPSASVRLRTLEHPVLVEVDVLSAGSDRIAVITEPCDFHLGLRMKECKGRGQTGIPRAELLGYLKTVAACLDRLYQETGMCHLALSPRQIVLTPRDESVLEAPGYNLSLLDFGLAELFWIPTQLLQGSVNPRYAPAEVFQGIVAGTSDQYSLAILFQEMLTGLHPFRNLNSRQLISGKSRGQPDFHTLPAGDRTVLARALSSVPEERFESCSEMIAALEEEAELESPSTVSGRASGSPSSSSGRTVIVPSLSSAGSSSTMKRAPGSNSQAKTPVFAPATVATGRVSPLRLDVVRPDWRPPLAELVASLTHGQEILSRGPLHYQVQIGSRIEQRCRSRMIAGMARNKLEAFQKKWNAELLTANESVVVYSIRTKAGFFKRMFGRAPGVDVVVQFRPSTETVRTPMLIGIRPIHCSGSAVRAMLDELGVDVLTSLQVALQTQSDRAEQERYPYGDRLTLWPLGPDGRLNRAVDGRGRDLGQQGMTLFVAEPVPEDRVDVQLTRWKSTETVRVPGIIRSRQPVGDGQVELEIEFESA